MLGHCRIIYCTRGVTISADILFFARVNPKTVKIILNNSPKCFSLSVTLVSSTMAENFSTPWETRNCLSIPNYDKSFSQKSWWLTFVLLTNNSLSFSTFNCSLLYLYSPYDTFCKLHPEAYGQRCLPTFIRKGLALYVFVKQSRQFWIRFDRRSVEIQCWTHRELSHWKGLLL